MTTATPRPGLSPSLCFDETALMNFLRYSRAAVDDTISQELNSMLEPSHDRFDPASTSQRRSGNPSRRQVASDSCEAFRKKVVFPTWQARSDVLAYCAGVATSPDPDDPEHVLRETEDARARERIVDERLDPYSGRYFPRQVRTERLAALIRNERVVEDIVRQRTWQTMRERCQEPAEVPSSKPLTFSEALDQWRTER